MTEQLATLATLVEEDDHHRVAEWLRKMVNVVHAARACIARPPTEDVRACIKIANDNGLYDAADWLTGAS